MEDSFETLAKKLLTWSPLQNINVMLCFSVVVLLVESCNQLLITSSEKKAPLGFYGVLK